MQLNLDSSALLNNEIEIPWFGLGVWQSKEGSEVENAVRWALEAGYKSIDTAAVYKNEEGVGKAVKKSGIAREELFITTKLWNSDQRSGDVVKAFENSLRKLACDYIDLYLIHWPVDGKFEQAWAMMEQLYATDKVKAIGVSNFHIHHLKKLLAGAEVVPTLNQVECHPYLQQQELHRFCQENKIQLQAWSPLMQGHFKDESVFDEIAERHGKTAAQVVLRWDLQKQIVTIPKSVNKDRILANSDIFNFHLSDEEMQLIQNLDRNQRFGPDPDNFEF